MAQAGNTVQVYAAASLTDAMNTLAGQYEKSHPDVDIVPVYASSSTVARQIANGAPAQIYVSANEQWMDWLGRQNMTLTGRKDLLRNSLVLIAPKASSLDNMTPDAAHPLAEHLQPPRENLPETYDYPD